MEREFKYNKSEIYTSCILFSFYYLFILFIYYLFS
jgi:hypothetical protein